MNAQPDSTALRQDVIDTCRAMNAAGVNQGTSGNVSVRTDANRMLITPSGVPYDAMTPAMIVSLPLNGGLDMPGTDGRLKPSTEWRFHKALLQARPDMMAVVHAHPVHCTALAMTRKPLPACHYMIAAFGGNDVRMAEYDLFGSAALARGVVAACTDRHGCLMANHGAVVMGETLAKGLWRMVELETLVQGYLLAQTAGGPVILSADEIAQALVEFESYGLVER